MAQDDTEKNDAPGAGPGLDLLERAWDAQWALRLVCVLLFFDMAMLLHVKRGVWQWSEVGKRLLEDLGWLAVTFVAFSAIAAVVVPACFIALRQFSAFVAPLLPRFLTASDRESGGRPLGYVYASDFHRLALQEQSDFLLRIYENDQRRKSSGELAVERMGDLVAAALVAGFADWFLGHCVQGGISLIGAIEKALGDWMPIVTAIIALCAWSLLKFAWFPPYKPNLIYYPPLDHELREKEREGRRPQR